MLRYIKICQSTLPLPVDPGEILHIKDFSIQSVLQYLRLLNDQFSSPSDGQEK